MQMPENTDFPADGKPVYE